MVRTSYDGQTHGCARCILSIDVFTNYNSERHWNLQQSFLNATSSTFKSTIRCRTFTLAKSINAKSIMERQYGRIVATMSNIVLNDTQISKYG
jgi:hypothetical protein